MLRATFCRGICGALMAAVASSTSAAGSTAPHPPRPASALQDAQSADEELAAARAEADRKRRRGDRAGARRDLQELVDDDPEDAEARALLALVRRDGGEWEQAVALAERAAKTEVRDPAIKRFAARVLAELELELGRAGDAVAALAPFADSGDPRDLWLLGCARMESGDRAEARATLARGAETPDDAPWDRLLAKARCERRLGFLERASRTLVAALAASTKTEHVEEPDLLVELAELYFEADGEVDAAETKARSPVPLCERALAIDASHERAKLALHAIYRFNWVRQRRNAGEILAEVLTANPRSIAGLTAALSADLDDGALPAARARLAVLDRLAPARRDVRAAHAALAWIEHDRDRARSILAELASADAADSAPERDLGEHLNELYRFAEAVPFLKSAVERDAGDFEAWTQYGRALANTGDEKTALIALQRAEEAAKGRADAWRNNTRIVLAKLARDYREEAHGELSFAWTPTPATVFRAYWVPFYGAARAELAQRYGFTPSPTHIEVFDTWRDFSVRSTGFEGFPALGVCFGPVVTAVSPVSELRGKFSWERTAFHEFTHVIHLGLSHNRCPRWITEGLATWEEENRHANWTRNMRRDLVDALANDDLIKVRDMNRAFRGPRILFGYYQSGLVCRMWIEKRGFATLVRVLEEFDRGADLDQTLARVFQTTPEEVDREFEAFVRARVASLAIEPRWSDTKLASFALACTGEPPGDPSGKRAFADDLCSLAWAQWQRGRRLDAEQALRRVDALGLELPRAAFLRGEIALSRDLVDVALESYRRGFALGGEDFRARMALGKKLAQSGETAEAERQFLAAEQVFPGYEERGLAAEIALAALYDGAERAEDALRARERWLVWNDDYELALAIARGHAQAGRAAEACAYFPRAAEVDPFRRALHVEWATAAEQTRDFETASREWRIACQVPAELDADAPGELPAALHASFLVRAAQAFVKLGRGDEAKAAAREALALDAQNADARELAGP